MAKTHLTEEETHTEPLPSAPLPLAMAGNRSCAEGVAKARKPTAPRLLDGSRVTFRLPFQTPPVADRPGARGQTRGKGKGRA